MNDSSRLDAVERYFRALQERLCRELEAFEPAARFAADRWQREAGGGGLSRVLADGKVFERGGVNYSRVHGEALPAAASQRRPELAGRDFVATGVSLVMHPQNPHVPTTHLNVRYFQAGDIWWFGGGFDLTPYYPVHNDVVAWHQQARAALADFGDALYPRFKRQCDEYFYLPHRGETRGVGGLFFDDHDEGGFDTAFAMTRSVAEHFLPAYTGIVERRREAPWGERERHFQLYRRGRYVEFNLLYDRGTLFGLQSGGRAESILMSLPPLVRWDYDWRPEPGSPEEALQRDYLRPRDWLADT